MSISAYFFIRSLTTFLLLKNPHFCSLKIQELLNAAKLWSSMKIIWSLKGDLPWFLQPWPPIALMNFRVNIGKFLCVHLTSRFYFLIFGVWQWEGSTITRFLWHTWGQASEAYLIISYHIRIFSYPLCPLVNPQFRLSEISEKLFMSSIQTRAQLFL